MQHEQGSRRSFYALRKAAPLLAALATGSLVESSPAEAHDPARQGAERMAADPLREKAELALERQTLVDRTFPGQGIKLESVSLHQGHYYEEYTIMVGDKSIGTIFTDGFGGKISIDGPRFIPFTSQEAFLAAVQEKLETANLKLQGKISVPSAGTELATPQPDPTEPTAEQRQQLEQMKRQFILEISPEARQLIMEKWGGNDIGYGFYEGRACYRLSINPQRHPINIFDDTASVRITKVGEDMIYIQIVNLDGTTDTRYARNGVLDAV